MRVKKILTIYCSIVLICLTAIIGASYALFNQTISVGNHLQAGNLEASLTRTNLEYAVLDSEGVLTKTTVDTDVDFTNKTKENIFGLNKDSRIVPGSYFEAEMQLANNGTVAYDYSVEIHLISRSNEQVNELAKQLKVTFKVGDKEESHMLSELIEQASKSGGKYTIASGRLPLESNTGFTVRVEFVLSDNNNAAQDQACAFDLVINAVQATKDK